MNIESLSSDKLKVNLSSADLDRYDLDYMSISTDSPGTKRMLKDILFEAEELSGFTAKNCRLLIEVLPGKSDGCVLVLTRMPKENGKKLRSCMMLPGKAGSYILSCMSIDDTINAVNRFARYPDIPLVNSSLYNFNGRYHLTFTPVAMGLDKTRLCALLADLSEYGDASQTSPVQEAMIAEHGSAIRNTRAIESILRFFH